MEKLTADETAAMEAMRVAPAPEPEEFEVVEAEEAKPEPVKVAEPAKEPAKPEPEPAKEPEAERQRLVPHQALHEERERRKELERRLAELEARVPKPAPQPEPEAPDPLTDPAAFNAWQKAELRKRDERIEALYRQDQERMVASARYNEAARYEAEFVAKTPDYMAAATYLRDQRIGELRALGYDEAVIPQIIGQDANAIFDNAKRAGRNPAEMLYESARLRGYRAAVAEAKPDEGQKLAALAKAQAATESLSNAPGGDAPGGYTLKQLAAMDEAALAKVPADVKRKLLGA